jgi:hypothetical protein
MRTGNSLRDWVFALCILAAFPAAAYYLIGDRLDVSTEGGAANGSRVAGSEAVAGSGIIVKREHGQCRQLSFDKETGEIRDNSLGPCPNSIGATPDSTEGRMQSVRKTFSGR